MADGAVALDLYVQRLRSLGAMTKDLAPRVATTLDELLLRDAAAQVGPDGKPWPRTQSGAPALAHVRKYLSVRAIDTVVLCRLEGHYARHHLGAVRGGKAGSLKRPILPTSKIPDPMARTLKRLAIEEFNRRMAVGGAP